MKVRTYIAPVVALPLLLSGCSNAERAYTVRGVVHQRQVDYDCGKMKVDMSHLNAFTAASGGGGRGTSGGSGSRSGSGKGRPSGESCTVEYELFIKNRDGLFEQDVEKVHYEKCTEREKFPECTEG